MSELGYWEISSFQVRISSFFLFNIDKAEVQLHTNAVGGGTWPMLIWCISLLVFVTLILTQDILLFPIDILAGLHFPHWLSLALILGVLSWCLGEWPP